MLHRKSIISKAVSVHILGLALSGFAHSALAAEENNEKERNAIEVIEVTAQKRIQNIQDVPVSVTAISGDMIDDSELSTFADIVSLAPGITLDQGSETRTTSISIRGVGSSQNNMGIEPSTTLMIDGEVLARSSALNGDLMDTERVEVLRGPQGTLFGKNTSSGVVHYVTKRPEMDDNYGRVKLSTDQYNLKKAEFMYNIGLTNNFALRFNLAASDTDGFMENLKPGQENIGKKDSQGARLQLLYTPTDDLEILLRAERQESSNNCCGSTIIKTDPTKQFNAHLAHPAVKDFVDNNTGWGNLNTFMEDDQISDLESTAFSAEINYNLGDSTITYTAHNRDWELYNNTEFAGATLNNSARYFGGINAFESNQHELRIASNGGGSIDYVAGLFYQKVEQLRDANEAFCNQTAKESFWNPDDYAAGTNPTEFDADGDLLRCRNGWDLTIIPEFNGGKYNLVNEYMTTVDSENKAIFGQIDFHLTDAFTVFAGGRYLEETSELYYEGGRQASAAANKQLNGKTMKEKDLAALDFTHKAISKDDIFIYRFGGQYRFTDDIMVYSSYGTGYKGVGWYNGIGNKQSDIADPEKNPVRPEESESVEIGVRSDWFENQLRVNGTIFRTEYTDFQERVREIDEDSEGDVVGSALFVNAGKVVTQGLELEFTALVSDNFTLEGSAAYIDATYDEFGDYFQNCPPGLKGTDECKLVNDGKLEVLILEGRTLAKAPKYQFRIDARYDFEMLGQDSFARLGYRWKDDIQYRFDHNPETIHPSFGLLDLFVGTSGEIAGRDYKLNLFVKNLLDETYYTRLATRSNQIGGGLRGIIGKDSQRYWGASFTLNF